MKYGSYSDWIRNIGDKVKGKAVPALSLNV